MGDTGKRTYLITGGTGSLGTTLTKKLLSEGHKVRALARNEHGHEKLEHAIPKDHHERLSCLIGDVRDLERVRRAARGADFLIHAAAQKIIPLAEYNPLDCVKTNIDGTANAINAAIDCGIERAVLVSTDKARSPSTHYGATKLCAERLWLAANRYRGASGCGFMAVAYGNVWASRGSVITAFEQQAQYGHIQVTDLQMTRFHITLEDAAAFVLDALDTAAPGILRIPKLRTYKIVDLARAFMEVYELKRDYVVTGRRPAEKLHEELVSETESCTVRKECDTYYELEPGVIHQQGGWSYTSGRPQAHLGVQALKGLVQEWAGLTS